MDLIKIEETMKLMKQYDVESFKHNDLCIVMREKESYPSAEEITKAIMDEAKRKVDDDKVLENPFYDLD